MPSLADDGVSPTDMEVALWYAIRDSHVPSDFRVYLKQFPSGFFAELAANRLANLDPSSPRVALGDIVPLSRAVMGEKTLMRMDKAFWNSIKDSKDPNDYAVYLRKFPEGVFYYLARDRLETLIQ